MVHHRVLALIAVAGLALTSCGGSGTPVAGPGQVPAEAPGKASTETPRETSAPSEDASSTTSRAGASGGELAVAGTRSNPAARSAVKAARAVVVLDPGHNGDNAGNPRMINKLVPAGGFRKPCNTTGTATDSGYAEHSFNWDVARRTAKLLRAKGIVVHVTRHDDDGVGPCVDRRAGIANTKQAALAVSIHADGASSHVRGYHVIEPGLAPDKKNRAILAASDRAARALLAAFGRATGEPRASYPGSKVQAGLTRRSDLAGLNLARVPAVFIECGNMRNAGDARRLSSAAWRQRAAQGIADGILAYLR